MKASNFAHLFFLLVVGMGCRKETAAIVTPQPPVAVPQVPVVSTVKISAVTQQSAASGGNVSSDGGLEVNFRGVCWSTNDNPTISDKKTVDGMGTGAFTSAMTGLTDGATYYVRAYATSSAGTGYGESVIFNVLVIGEAYQGGVLAYLLKEGDLGYNPAIPHGLVASPADIVKTKWNNKSVYSNTGATATGYGTGNANTNTVVSKQGAGYYAASYCADLVSGGHDDWYLPSRDELNKLYINRAAIGNFATTTVEYYWASSELGYETAWIQNFTTGAQYTYDKGGVYLVRAVRAF